MQGSTRIDWTNQQNIQTGANNLSAAMGMSQMNQFGQMTGQMTGQIPQMGFGMPQMQQMYQPPNMMMQQN